MELQLAQNDPRGQDWCKVNLLVTDKSHSGSPFSLYHLIMTLLCSGQVEHGPHLKRIGLFARELIGSASCFSHQ